MARMKVRGTNINKPTAAEANTPLRGKVNPDQLGEHQNLLRKLKEPSSKVKRQAAVKKKALKNNPNRKLKNG
jgi:hypothetical protein